MAGESQQVPDSSPDPSVLTQDQIARMNRAERDYVDGRIAVIQTRIDRIDKATEVFHETLTRVPTETQREVAHLESVMIVKFDSIIALQHAGQAAIALQFKERDTRSERESRDNKVAVDAAFAAQKEAAAKQDEGNQKAIDKSEKATNESINKLGDVVKASNDNLRTMLDDLKAQLGEVRSTVAQVAAARAGVQESHAAIYALVGFVLALIVAGVTVAGFAAGK